MVGRRRWHFFPYNEFSGSGYGKAGGAAIAGGLGAMSSWGRGGDFGGNTDGQKRTVLCCQFKAFN